MYLLHWYSIKIIQNQITQRPSFTLLFETRESRDCWLRGHRGLAFASLAWAVRATRDQSFSQLCPNLESLDEQNESNIIKVYQSALPKRQVASLASFASLAFLAAGAAPDWNTFFCGRRRHAWLQLSDSIDPDFHGVWNGLSLNLMADSWQHFLVSRYDCVCDSISCVVSNLKLHWITYLQLMESAVTWRYLKYSGTCAPRGPAQPTKGHCEHMRAAICRHDEQVVRKAWWKCKLDCQKCPEHFRHGEHTSKSK